MTKSILATPPCPHNPTFFYQDTPRLTELFLLAYQYHYWQPETEAMMFIEKLRQLVGLGYKICRPYPQRRSAYNLYRHQFLHYDHGDFRRHFTLIETFTCSMAKMVQWAIQSYQAQGYPESYETYLQVLEETFKNEKILWISKQEDAYRLLEELRQLY